VNVTVRYLGPLAAEAGSSSEVFAFSSGVTLRDVLRAVTASRGPGFRRLILDGSGEVEPFVLVTLNGKMVPGDQDPMIDDKAEITLAVAVSGG